MNEFLGVSIVFIIGFLIGAFTKIKVTVRPKAEKKDFADFLDSIREYENESNHSVGHDERDSIEFVDIYMNKMEKQNEEKN